MTFRCERCDKPFEARMQYDVERDCQVVACPHCGAEHDEVERSGSPGAPVDIRFSLRSPGVR